MDLLAMAWNPASSRGVALDGGHRVEQGEKGGLIPGEARGGGGCRCAGTARQQEKGQQKKGETPHVLCRLGHQGLEGPDWRW